MSENRIDRRGIWVAVFAYVIWGVMPLYWHLLKVVPSLEIIAHRIVWSTVLVAGWLLWKYGRGWLRETLAMKRAAWMLAISGTLIAFNWGLYIWAVNAGHVVETSLGYFINPLLNVVLGVVLLRERLNRVQWLSVAIAACGVLWLTFNYGDFPWIAITLACSFAGYGLVRKLVGVPPVRGLGVESLYLFLPALAAFSYLIVFGSIIGFSAYICLLHHVRPALACSYAYVNPAIAVMLGAWLAHERFSASELAAMGVILMGVVAITLAKASKAKPAVVVAEEGAA